VKATREGRLLDGFRVQDGQIVELWGATASLAALAVVVEAELRAPATETARVDVARLSLAPGSEIPMLIVTGPLALAVETGAVEAQPDATERLNRATFGGDPSIRPVERGKVRTLAAGDQLVVGVGEAIGLRNDGALPAAILAVAVFPPSVLDPVQPGNGGTAARSMVSSHPIVLDDLSRETRWPNGVEAQHMSTGLVPLPEADWLEITAARAMVGSGVEVRGVAERATLLAVEEGSLLTEGSGGGVDPATVMRIHRCSHRE
jgi:hypothetical protein